MKQLIKNVKQVLMLLMVISIIGCDDDQITLPEIVAEYTYTIATDNSGIVTFINTSENATSYEWDFGDGISSDLNNPIHQFTQSGEYTVVITAINIAGATTTFESIITIIILDPASLPLNFDDDNVKYDDVNVFGGVSFTVVENPDVSGSNNTASGVGSITNIGGQYEGFSFELGEIIDLTTDQSIIFDFWSDVPVDVLVKLENPDGSFTETIASHGGNGWEELIFTFNSSATYSILTIFVDGPGTTAGTFYIDNINQSVTVDLTLPIITLIGDATINLALGDTYTEQGATATDDLDGDISGSIVIAGDTVDTVAEGTFIITYNVTDSGGNAAIEVTRTVNVTITDITAPTITLTGDATINLIIGDTYTEQGATASDNIDGDISSDIVIAGATVDTNTAGTYIITYNVTDAAGNAATEVTRTIIVAAAPAAFDDGLLTNGDFENGAEAWTGNATNVLTEGGNSYNFADVAVAGNPWEANLSQVVEIIQGKNYKLTFDASSNGSRTMLAGIGLNQDPWTNVVETVNLTTTTQTFTYNFSSADFGGVNSRVLFDLGADSGVVVIDNVSLFCLDCGTGGGTGGGTGTGAEGDLTANGGFETGDVSDWTLFVDNPGATFTATDSAAACGTFSGNLMSDFASGTGGAVDAVVKQANIGIGTITPNTQVTISFDIRGSVTDGGVFFAEFFSELSGGGTSKAEILSGGPLSLTDNWTHYSFTTTTGSDVSGGITLQMKTSCGPVAGCVVDAFFDNVFVGIGATGGINGTIDCTTTGGGTGGGTGGTGGTGTGDEMGVNGDFETGDVSDWTTFVDAVGASFTASSTNPSSGSFSGNLVADFASGTGGAVDAVVKQANLGAGGTALANTEYVIAFDLRGSASDGGVFFVEFFSELSGGGTSKAEIITGGPHPLTDNWTSYSYTVTTGPDVSGGITLQLKSSCGPVAGCLVDVFFDNVSIKLK